MIRCRCKVSYHCQEYCNEWKKYFVKMFCCVCEARLNGEKNDCDRVVGVWLFVFPLCLLPSISIHLIDSSESVLQPPVVSNNLTMDIGQE